MITGIIAGVILIAVLPPAIDHGEWGVVAVAVIAALFFLVLGFTSRESDRAYLHRTEYWAKSGKDRAKARHKWEAEARAEEERERRLEADRRATKRAEQFAPVQQVRVAPKRTYTPVNTQNAVASYNRMCREADAAESERRRSEMGNLLQTGNRKDPVVTKSLLIQTTQQTMFTKRCEDQKRWEGYPALDKSALYRRGDVFMYKGEYYEVL